MRHANETHSPDDLIGRISSRVARINKLSAWQDHLIQELNETRAELAAVRSLATLYQRAAGVDPDDPPPAQLVAAWHVPHPEPCLVDVEIDGAEVTLIVSGAARDPNPAREYRDWQQIQEAHRRVRDNAGEAS